MTEPNPAGQSLGPYAIVRKLGQGGMGEVFLARDPRLGREVALKVLPEELVADPERRSRFLREARAAAALKHPNITTIYEVGETNGRDYIAFEYVEGPTLQQRIAERRLGLSELSELAVPLADALAYAHGRGVVHRDLKAANVMLTEHGLPKLLDFGLAKVLHESVKKEKTTTLTLSGAIFGTPGAMSPEQALGRTVDERSDVFSFGSLLYEMASGRPAFSGTTVMETMDAVIHAEPESLARSRRDLPPDFLAIVEKALRKDPAERYQHMADLAADLRHFKRKTDSGLVPPREAARGRRPWLVGAVALPVLALAAALWWSKLAADDPGTAGAAALGPARTVGVLGFENLSDPADERHVGRMLMGLITTDLSESGGLDVISTPRILAALREIGGEGRGFDSSRASEAAERAGVQVMLVGQVAQRGAGLLLTTELVDVREGRTLGSWTRESDTDAGLFELADAIGDGVRERLGVQPVQASAGGLDLARTLTTSAEAYRQYSAGEIALHEMRFVDAAGRFAQAIKVDPSFALAYYRLGMACEWQAREDDSLRAYRDGLAHLDRLPERWQGVHRAALARQEEDYPRAYEELARLEDRAADLADYQNVLGEVLTHGYGYEDPLRARRCFEKALELDPTFKIVFFHLIQDCILADDPQAIENLLARYRASDPADPAVVSGEITLLLARGRFQEALDRIEAEGLEAPSMWHLHVLALFLTGQPERAEAIAGERIAQEVGYLRDDGLHARAACRLAQGRIREALDDYRAGLSADPTRLIGDHLELALAQGAIGSHDEAADTIREALRTNALACYAHFWLGHFLCEAGRTDEAAQVLAELRAVAPRIVSPTIGFWEPLLACEVQRARGEHDAARRSLGTAASAAEEYRDRPTEALVRARLAEACGERAQAIAAYREILAPPYLRAGSEWNGEYCWRPFEIPVLYELARLEEGAGELDSALDHYRRFLDHWGRADVELPGVEDARARLARLDQEDR